MAVPAPILPPEEPAGERPARLADLVGLGRLFLGGLGFWTAVALVFAVQDLLVLGTSRFPVHRLIVGQGYILTVAKAGYRLLEQQTVA
jgi:hypothetical protein